ncbi:hypothetical protein GGX14DRAFT_565448 [Mycena pura]|uniref:Uncharacterized protein n=1 Tax=Mycena pura TaxID=153505 RepID=A0AAD6YAX1_9AGAR|nr:hypothetical protein GGX14DRAFT_565448 [Mycena pura]
MIFLFILSTIHITLAYTWAFMSDRAQTGIYQVFTLANPLPVLYDPDDPAIVRRLGLLIKIRYCLSNWIADGIFVHRCYVIWGRKWQPVALPAFSYFCTIVGGIVELLPLSGNSQLAAMAVCMGTIFCTNVLSTSLAAGRIWWISRRIAKLQGAKNPRKRYMELTAILIESGLIYPVTLVVIIGLWLTPATSIASVLVTVGACYHIVAIAPTLIIVRIGMGVSTDDVDTTLNLSREAPDQRGVLTTMEFQVQPTREKIQGSLTDSKEMRGWNGGDETGESFSVEHGDDHERSIDSLKVEHGFRDVERRLGL